MLMTAMPRRRIALVVALLAAAAVFLTSPGLTSGGQPALAAPGGAPGTDDEGGTPALRKVLDAANKGFIEARVRLDNSKKRQLALGLQLKTLETRHAQLLVEVGYVAAVAYRNGRLITASTLLESNSPDAFWQRATVADTLARVDGKQLRRLAPPATRSTGPRRTSSWKSGSRPNRWPSWPDVRRTPNRRWPRPAAAPPPAGTWARTHHRRGRLPATPTAHGPPSGAAPTIPRPVAAFRPVRCTPSNRPRRPGSPGTSPASGPRAAGTTPGAMPATSRPPGVVLRTAPPPVGTAPTATGSRRTSSRTPAGSV